MSEQIPLLLVEDDEFILSAYKTGLMRAGFNVETVSNGGKVVEAAKAFKPRIILLDVILPVKDGFDVMADLQADVELAGTPVVFLTNLGQESDVQRGKNLGAKDYLIKAHHSMAEVVAKVKSILES